MSKMSYEHTPLTSPLDGRLWHQLLDSKAEQQPDTEAVIMYDMDMKRSAMTYAEYRDRSTYLAASLLDLGLSRAQRVLLIGQTSLEYVVFVMALHRTGANAILLGAGGLTPDKVNLLKRLNCQMIAYDPQMKESQTRQLMEGLKQLTEHNVNNKILVSLRDFDQDFYKNTCHAYENLLERGQSQNLQKIREAQAQVQFDDPTVAICTAGSTGEPKAVQLTMHGCVNFFTGSPFALPGMPRVKVCIDRPVSWIGGYLYAHSPLCTNITVVVLPSEMVLFEATVEKVFQIWEKEKCSYCGLVTASIKKLVSESLHKKYDLSHIKGFIMGGQRYSLSTEIAPVFEIFPFVKIAMVYASTESSKICMALFGKDYAIEGKYAKFPISPGMEVKIVDDNNKMVSRGTTGEICVRGYTVFLEYMDNPEATIQAKSPTGWVHTGDIGILDDDGKIKVLGRKTEMIKRATLKIFPAEIEKVLLQHPNVADVVVVGIPDQRLHEEICACVILRANEEEEASIAEARLQKLEDWCEQQWPPGPDGLSLKPKYFLPMKSFPLMSSGKVFTRGIKEEAMKQLGVLY